MIFKELRMFVTHTCVEPVLCVSYGLKTFLHYIFPRRNVRCGSLQCQRGSRAPMIAGKDKQYTRTIVSIGGQEYECK